MNISIKQMYALQKSRLAGFFLCLVLSACQPASESSPGALELAKAEQALQRGLTLKAAEHFAISIQQRNPAAAGRWLELTKDSLGPLQQYQQLRNWSAEPIAIEHAVSLGLWRDAIVMKPNFSALVQPIQCQINLQPVLSSATSVQHWQRLQSAWRESDLADLPICFLSPVLLDSRDLDCSEDVGKRITCNSALLSELMQQSPAQLLFVAAGRGGASYNNGWLQLPEHFSPELFRHEFSHALGFLDEYALVPAVAATECVRKDILPNLLLSRDDASRYARFWRLNLDELQWTEVDSCRAQGITAWRPIQVDSHMQHYELPIPDLYLHIMAQQLERAHLIMPVQYYFAYRARQQNDMQRWKTLMQRAADFGYLPAQEALSAADVSLSAR